jgi:DNA-binding transcriptional LysR family regulator
MRIRNLETFVKVAELESFHAAAKVLKATQPTVSSRVAALEADLGTSLFRRDQGGTTLTSRSRQLLPYAQRIVSINDEMKAQLKQDLNEAGSVRIGLADTLAQLWVGPLLKEWRREFPHVEFEVVIDLSDHLLQQISRHELDMVLMVSHPENEILLSEHLCSYPQVWMASNEYVQEKNLASEPLNLWQLSRCSVLSFPRNTKSWHYLENLFSKMAEDRPMLHTCSSVSHLMNLTNCVEYQ